MDSIPTFEIVPLDHGADSKANFGASIYGLDLGNMTDEDLAKLKNAILRYQVVIVKSQQALVPKKNWELLERLDPEASPYSSEQFGKLFHPTGEGIIEKLKVATIPNAGQIHLIGKGYQGDEHYGLKKLNLGEAFANGYYSKPLAEEDFERGVARFQSWHMDGPLYKANPPMFSSFRIVKFPVGEQEVDWADGSGLKKKVRAGRTAFFSTSQLYNLLSADEKMMVDHSWAEYMFYPYEWIRASRGNPNGLGVACEGREVSDEDLAARCTDRDPSWTQMLPMVWVNPATGVKAFQVQPNCVRRIFVRNGPNEKPDVIEDVTEVRGFLNKLQSRIVRPEYIYTGPEEEGDHLLWYNWGLMHSRIDYPIKFGPRITHQGWIPSSRAPAGPVPVPAGA